MHLTFWIWCSLFPFLVVFHALVVFPWYEKIYVHICHLLIRFRFWCVRGIIILLLLLLLSCSNVNTFEIDIAEIETKKRWKMNPIEKNRKGMLGIRYADRAKPINCKYINSKNKAIKKIAWHLTFGCFQFT